MMSRKTVFASLALSVVLLASRGRAESPPPDPSPTRTAKNVAYAEVATSILTGAASLNYERHVVDWLSLRVGFGMGWWPTGTVLEGLDVEAKFAATFMANFLVGAQNPWMLELGVGASYVEDPFRLTGRTSE